ncbi:hypothetical protein BO94DRAFT_150066 [Aspergillus sclerotioniger CBS 115572]|uniref:Ankyrin n=1 Tax=Aspergillus sclerotioniger CBS 115572 TaxID=1450535 RepID=A0A317W6C1_9EURO|nr:hypothetical protein BO94DRAFT_150066 [Aspergillus sclerotioniger CBS 115572]PWY80787.1 hypothetical protein BO94DRAFT_150066 [Aspergillus sclerotioniger CBS 115572]
MHPRYPMDPEFFRDALRAAIRCHSADSVDVLLRRGGGNPDVYDLSKYERQQSEFLRFLPKSEDGIRHPPSGSRAELLAAMDENGYPAQTVHITEEEVEEGRWQDEFWTQSSRRVDPQQQNVIHPLILAAWQESTAVVNRLIAEPPRPSALAISSPVHEAIARGNNTMLRHLLARGFSPNTLPLGNVRESITPLMSTFLHRTNETWDEAAYDILAQDPRIDLDLRSPFMLVHILHFATAYSLTALKRVERDVPLSHADTTAYGRTLLYIACLPKLRQRFASKVRESIHALRCHYSSAPETKVECEAELGPQLKLIQYLLASGTQSVTAYDTDLNTPLHYLASARVINEEAIALLRAQPDGEVMWTEWRNWYGYTAEELYEKVHRKRKQKDSWYGGTTLRVAKMPKLRLRW